MESNKATTMIKIVLFCALCVLIKAHTPDDVSKLNRYLLKDYDRRVRGTMNLSTQTMVMIETVLTSITEFEELSGRFSFVAYFLVYWRDERLQWNISEYNRVRNTHFYQSDIWHPMLTLSQSSDTFKRFGHNWLLMNVSSKGHVLWTVGDLYHATCRPDVTLFPFDIQVCDVVFMLTGRSGEEIELRTIQNEVNLDVYSPHGSWDLINTRTYVEYQFGIIQKYHIVLTMKRESQFYVVGLILPIATLGILNLLVFLLPPESGERVGFSITVLLALAVFLTMASENLPKTSKPRIPLICVKLYVDMVISSAIMLFTIVALRMYHRDDGHPVPPCLLMFTRCCLCKCFDNNTRITNCKDTNMKQNASVNKDTYITVKGDGSKNLSVCELPLKTDYSSITWKDVAKAFDLTFFVITFAAFMLSHSLMVLYIYA